MYANPTNSFPTVYPGPREHDPLTDDELTLLLAVPRAAESTPDAILFRLPLGPDPSMGWVDATCAEVCSIVARLAEVWNTRLSKILSRPGEPDLNRSVGPGLIICLLVEPNFHAVFHLLAFWALGCTVQFVSTSDPSILQSQISQSGCEIVIYSGFDDDWVVRQKECFSGVIVPLPEEEQAHRLAQREKQGQVGAAPPWPAPRRPTPALITQSSGTTGLPKLLRFPLHFYTIGHALDRQMYLSLALSGKTSKTPYTHPRLILAPFSWQSFHAGFFVHLTTGTPLAFAHFTNILDHSSSQLIEWATAFDVGAISGYVGIIFHMARPILEANAEFFRSLFLFSLTGAAFDSSLCETLARLGIQVTNIYGVSEFGRLLGATSAPYMHLRPFPDIPPLLVRPISDHGPDGSRHVELWLSAATSPPVAHHLLHGGVPLKVEPFPGDGPHKGKPAVNLGDIFQEVIIDHNSASGTGTETAYIQLGRHSDQIRLARWVDEINATIYETQLLSEINARILVERPDGYLWTAGGAQLLGNNMPCTALIVQLHPLETRLEGLDQQPDGQLIQLIYDSINRVNDSLGLQGVQRVHAKKRSLVITLDGTFAYGEGAERFTRLYPTLSLTHKRTVRRWDNECKFKLWLDGLDFSEL